MHPAKIQFSLCTCTVWSESSLNILCITKDAKFAFTHSLIRVFAVHMWTANTLIRLCVSANWFESLLGSRQKIHSLIFLLIWFIYLFIFFLDLGFTALSRIFHLYRADRSSKVGENRRTRRKTTWPSVSRTWLSHIWPEWGSNHSGEKPNGLRVNSLIH